MNILITAGGTTESIDDVRYISNMSTGQLGVNIVNELVKYRITENGLVRPLKATDRVFYICNINSIKPATNPIVTVYETTDTNSVKLTIEKIMNEFTSQIEKKATNFSL